MATVPGPSGTGCHRESLVWNFFVFDTTKSKSIYQIQGQPSPQSPESTTAICGAEIAGKFPTNLKAHFK
jgi:hypothetical protein